LASEYINILNPRFICKRAHSTSAHLLVLFIGLLLSGAAYTHAQQGTPPSLPYSAERIALPPAFPDSTVRLRHRFIAAGTDTVSFSGMGSLRPGVDYRLNHGSGSMTFSSMALDRLRKQQPGDSLVVLISYRYIPLQLQDVYRKRTLVAPSIPITGRDSLRIARPVTGFSMEDVFGSGLQKSGSIVRGFTVGSNRDLSLNSGLRLQLSGKILSDVDITAALTDENTPIQPEGTTQTLQEFDKVFVEINAKRLSATLGDFVLDLSGTEFARLSRKLQGAKGTAQYRFGSSSSGATTVSGAVTRGRFATKQFAGLEGVQGPYLLTGQNNERDIIVIAGTERVFIDGEQQTRGETNDYTIDYSTGEVTFTPRRLITAASRITIDFEYSDRQFSRSLIAAQTSAALFSDQARLTVTYAREADDPDAPIDFVFSDSTRAIIAAAGNDRSKATMSGVTQVDSNGTYVRIDSVLASGVPVQFYRYHPGDPQALYVVSFTNVGAGKGDYSRQRAGVYTWRGPAGGEYLPIRSLPLPQTHQVVDVALDVSPVQDLKITGEFGFSNFDANRLSSIGDANNNGRALNVAASYDPKSIRIGGMDLGGMNLRYRERFVDSRFVPLDRANDIEFNRKWGVDSLATGDEHIREASLTYMPVQGVSVGSTYGTIKRGDSQDSRRLEGNVQIRGDNLPLLLYNVEDVRSTDLQAGVESRWLRNKGSLEYTLFGITPGVRYEGENRRSGAPGTGNAGQGSFRFDNVSVFTRIAALGPLSAQAEFGWRTDNVFHNNGVVRESDAFTQTYSAHLREWQTISSSLDVTLRRRSYSPEFKLEGRQDIQTVLVRSNTRVAPLNRGIETDVYYEVSTEQASRLERVYVRVTPGSGNYRYIGDANGNGLADDTEFVLTRFDGDYVALTLPTDELTPIIDLKASARVRVTPLRFIDGDGVFSSIVRALTSETYVRAEEKSSERDLAQIYMLHFSRFQQDATTIAGSMLFTQDFHIFENKPTFSTRFRYSERRGLTNFSGGIERGYTRERSIRLRWQLVTEIANQLDLVSRTDRVTGTRSSPRLRDIESNGLTFDISYRPEQAMELGLKFDVSRANDSYTLPGLRADLNAQTVRMVYAFQGSGQARAEFAREEVLLARGAETFPYELTGGRVAGKTWVWRGAFEYRITQFLQTSVNYEGRTEGGREPVHTARAEVRAFF
jgi:hypothetical protein